MNKYQITALTTLLTISTCSNSAIIDNGTYTTDTASGLDWLDLTESTYMSYSDVIAQLGTGGLFEGWRYASGDEVTQLVYNWGVTPNTTGDYIQTGAPRWGRDSINNDLIDDLIKTLGDTRLEFYDDTYGVGEVTTNEPGQAWTALGFTSDIADYDSYDRRWITRILDQDYTRTSDELVVNGLDEIAIHWSAYGVDGGSDGGVGSFLVRTSVVPIPAAAWLFGSGLIGLVGLARRKKA